LDEFVLWVNAETPSMTSADYVQAIKENPGKFKMGGTGAAQEDQIITIQFEQATGAKFIYVPFKGGGDVVWWGDYLDTLQHPWRALVGGNHL
jgi:putative tricarboxylic transport membrane protein